MSPILKLSSWQQIHSEHPIMYDFVRANRNGLWNKQNVRFIFQLYIHIYTQQSCLLSERPVAVVAVSMVVAVELGVRSSIVYWSRWCAVTSLLATDFETREIATGQSHRKVSFKREIYYFFLFFLFFVRKHVNISKWIPSLSIYSCALYPQITVNTVYYSTAGISVCRMWVTCRVLGWGLPHYSRLLCCWMLFCGNASPRSEFNDIDWGRVLKFRWLSLL